MISNISNEDQNHDINYFKRKSSLCLSTAEIEQRRRIYDETVQKLVEQKKIPTEEVKKDIEVLQYIVDMYRNVHHGQNGHEHKKEDLDSFKDDYNLNWPNFSE